MYFCSWRVASVLEQAKAGSYVLCFSLGVRQVSFEVWDGVKLGRYVCAEVLHNRWEDGLGVKSMICLVGQFGFLEIFDTFSLTGGKV